MISKSHMEVIPNQVSISRTFHPALGSGNRWTVTDLDVIREHFDPKGQLRRGSQCRSDKIRRNNGN